MEKFLQNQTFTKFMALPFILGRRLSRLSMAKWPPMPFRISFIKAISLLYRMEIFTHKCYIHDFTVVVSLPNSWEVWIVIVGNSLMEQSKKYALEMACFFTSFNKEEDVAMLVKAELAWMFNSIKQSKTSTLSKHTKCSECSMIIDNMTTSEISSTF